jgi:tetratricopeptide (TPR) repeat protein
MKYSFVADHFQYAAGMALIAAIVAALSRAKIPLIVFVAILCVLSWRQAHIYRGPETLWRDVIAKNSNSWMARNNLGAILAQQAADENAAGNREASIAKLELAIEQFKIVEQLRPQHEIAPFNYADALLRLGEFEESIDQYRKGIAVSRSSNSISRAYDRIGQMLEALNAPIQADTEYRCAIAADPKFADAHFRLARLLDRRKRPAAAIREFEIYVQLRPDDVRARTNLGMLYGVAGRFDEAANAFSAALEKDPEFAPAKKGLAISLEMKRRAASTRKAR